MRICHPLQSTSLCRTRPWEGLGRCCGNGCPCCLAGAGKTSSATPSSSSSPRLQEGKRLWGLSLTQQQGSPDTQTPLQVSVPRAQAAVPATAAAADLTRPVLAAVPKAFAPEEAPARKAAPLRVSQGHLLAAREPGRALKPPSSCFPCPVVQPLNMQAAAGPGGGLSWQRPAQGVRFVAGLYRPRPKQDS